MNKIPGWALVAGAAGLLALLFSRKSSAATGGGGGGGPIDSREAMLDAMTAAARRWGIPPRVVLATGEVESSNAWPPPGRNECGGSYGCTYYPMGIKPGAVFDEVNQMGASYKWPQDKAILDQLTADVATQIDAAAHRLARGMSKYGGDLDLVRIWWKNPGAAAEASQTGKWPSWYPGTSHDRWHAALTRWSAVS